MICTAAIWILCLSICQNGMAGLYYEQVSRVEPADGRGAGKEVRLRIFVQANRIRIEHPEEHKTVIARLDEGIVWEIQERQKAYAEATFDAIIANWQRMRKEKGIQENDQGIAVTHRGTDDRKSKAVAHVCEQYIITNGETPVLEVWTDPALNYPEKDTIFEYRARMGEFSPAVLQEIKRIPGFPLMMNAITCVRAEKVRVWREVTAIKQQEIDPKTFALPDGLRRMTAAGK